ncbi:MAG: hypothetical protein WAW61_13530 [Methylococcaceae bacterium]
MDCVTGHLSSTIAMPDSPLQLQKSDCYGNGVAVSADHGAPLSGQRDAAIDRMVSGAAKEAAERAGYRVAAAARAIAPYLAVAGITVKVVIQVIAATGHASREIGSAAALRERNGVKHRYQVAGNGDEATRGVDGATGQRDETAEIHGRSAVDAA